MVEDTDLDRVGATSTSAHTRGIPELTHLKNQFSLVDMWRERNPNVWAFTWQSPDQQAQSRIDRFYLSNALQKKYLQQNHVHNPWSDHKTISIYLRTSTPKQRGQGYWKLNTSLLEEDEYVVMIEDFLNTWKSQRQNHDSIQQWLRMISSSVSFLYFPFLNFY